eukprot:413446-Amphidinium_carterae.1
MEVCFKYAFACGVLVPEVTSHLHGFWNLSAEIVNGPTSVASDGTNGASGHSTCQKFLQLDVDLPRPASALVWTP